MGWGICIQTDVSTTITDRRIGGAHGTPQGRYLIHWDDNGVLVSFIPFMIPPGSRAYTALFVALGMAFVITFLDFDSHGSDGGWKTKKVCLCM